MICLNFSIASFIDFGIICQKNIKPFKKLKRVCKKFSFRNITWMNEIRLMSIDVVHMCRKSNLSLNVFMSFLKCVTMLRRHHEIINGSSSSCWNPLKNGQIKFTLLAILLRRPRICNIRLFKGFSWPAVIECERWIKIIPNRAECLFELLPSEFINFYFRKYSNLSMKRIHFLKIIYIYSFISCHVPSMTFVNLYLFNNS